MAAPTTAPAQKFWDDAFTKHDTPQLDPVVFRQQSGVTGRAFLDRLGDVRGKRILEIGCGSGRTTVYLALQGARVMATDFSSVAIEKTLELAKINGVADRIEGMQMDALNLRDLGQTYDLVTGRFILHHIEPFDQFCLVLRDVLVPGGRGVFLENNAGSPVLMFARKHIAGRFGIPKYGDDEEHPLLPEEVDQLRRIFQSVDVLHPDFVFFRKANVYVFNKNKAFKPIVELNAKLDGLVRDHIPALRKYGYRQIVEFTK